jgi:hypothetical protein
LTGLFFEIILKQKEETMKKSILISAVLLFCFLVCTASAVEVTLLGPKKYARTTGAPNVYTDSFPGRLGQGTLIVKSGDANGNNQISSAIIKINGTQILGPSDFNQNVYEKNISINLIENNKISLELRSQPGSYLIVQIKEEIEAEGAAVVGLGGGVVEVSNPDSPFYGFRVEIPPGSLKTPNIITISLPSIVNEMSNYLPNNLELAGIPAEFGPNGLTFTTPVSITLKYLDEDNDGLIDRTNISEDEIQVLRIIDKDLQENIPIVHLDKTSNMASILVNHFTTYAVTCSSSYIEYRWDMDPASAPDWEEDDQYGKDCCQYCKRDQIPNSRCPQPGTQYQFGAALNGGYSGLRIWDRVGELDRVKLRTKSAQFGDGTYIWRVYVPQLEPNVCGTIAAFLLNDNGPELDFEIGYGMTDVRKQYLHSAWNNPNFNLCYLADAIDHSHAIVPITVGWHELKIKITAGPDGYSKVISWFIDIPLSPKTDNLYMSFPSLWHIYCSAEIQPNYLGDNFPTKDFSGYFDYAIYRNMVGPLPFFDDFEDGNLDGWEIPWAGQITATTENKKNGNYSMKIYDNSTSPLGTGVRLTLNTIRSRIGIEFYEWTNDFGWNGGSAYSLETTLNPSSGWGFYFGATVYTNNNWKYCTTQDKSVWAIYNPLQYNGADFPTPAGATTYSWHKLKLEVYGPEGRAKFWYDDQFKGEIIITPTTNPIRYFNHGVSWSTPVGTINYIDDFRAYEIPSYR